MAFSYSLLGAGKGHHSEVSLTNVSILITFLAALTALSFDLLAPTWLPLGVSWITQNNNREQFNAGNLVYTKSLQSPTSDVALDVTGDIVFKGGDATNTWNVKDQNGRSQFSVGNAAASSGAAAQVRTANNVIDDGLTGSASFAGVINGPANGTLIINGQDGSVGGPVMIQTNGTLALTAESGKLNSAKNVLDDGTGGMTVANGLSVNSNYGSANMNIKSNGVPVMSSFWNTWISGGVGGGAVYNPSTLNWTVYSSGTGESASFGGIEMGTAGVDLYAMKLSTPTFFHPQYTIAQFKKTRVFHAGPVGGAGAAGGLVASCDANGNYRNKLDDGNGNLVVAGNLTVAGTMTVASSVPTDITIGGFIVQTSIATSVTVTGATIGAAAPQLTKAVNVITNNSAGPYFLLPTITVVGTQVKVINLTFNGQVTAVAPNGGTINGGTNYGIAAAGNSVIGSVTFTYIGSNNWASV